MPRFWKQLLGNTGEKLAARYLRRQGFRILARQYSNHWGEIDLIALDGETLVFVEVKTRRSTDAGHPADAVDRQKQGKLTRAALAFLKRQKWLDRPVRFDVVAVISPDDDSRPEITHYRHAFEPTGRGQMFT